MAASWPSASICAIRRSFLTSSNGSATDAPPSSSSDESTGRPRTTGVSRAGIRTGATSTASRRSAAEACGEGPGK